MAGERPLTGIRGLARVPQIELVARADEALYAAKRGGRDRVVTA